MPATPATPVPTRLLARDLALDLSLVLSLACAGTATFAAGPQTSAVPAASSASAASNPQLLPPFEIAALHRTRSVRVWLPPSYASAPDRRYPVLYLHDGQNVFSGPGVPWGGWGVGEAMTELARTRGFEAIVVAIDHGGEHRVSELSPWPNKRGIPVEGPAYLAFVVDVLKPWVDAHYRTRPGRESTAMIGSPLGALSTQDALLRYPQVFGKAALFSPAYWFTPAIYDETKRHPWPAGTRTYLYAGGAEDSDMVPDVERMMGVLAGQPHPPADIALHIEPANVHDERAWRAEFPRAVSWLFQLPAVP